MTRQQAWQERKRCEGKCRVCGKPSGGAARCRVHADAWNAYRRDARARLREAAKLARSAAE